MKTTETGNVYVVVGLGEVLFDHDVTTDKYAFGGAPANFADHFLKCSRIVAELTGRCEVHVVSAVGNDPWGVLIEKELTERGLLFEGHLPVKEGLPTGIVDKTKDEKGVNRYDIKQGAWDNIDLPDEVLDRLATTADVVCFGSLAQRKKVSHDTIVRLLDKLITKTPESIRVFDVNIRQEYYSEEVLRKSIARCNVLKISEEEAVKVCECLTGYKIGGDPGYLCRALMDKHPNVKMVILTEGADGSRVFVGEHRVSTYVIPKENREKPEDTVGAGDSFTAAFCAMLLAGKDVWEAQLFASRVAAYVCGFRSATPEYPAGAAEWTR